MEKRAGLVELNEAVKPFLRSAKDITPARFVKNETLYKVIRTVMRNLKTGKRLVEAEPLAGTLKYLTKGVIS